MTKAMDSPELRELKKQTRMTAEERASYGGACWFVVSMFAAIFFGLSFWQVVVVSLAAGATGWWAAYHYYTKDDNGVPG